MILDKFIKKLVTSLYGRPDSEYITSTLRILFIGFALLVTYTSIDYYIAILDHARGAEVWYHEYTGPHIGHLFMRFPWVGLIFKFIAFICLPLCVFFARKWMQTLKEKHNWDIERVEALTKQLAATGLALEKERDRFRTVVDTQMEYITKIKPNGLITFANHKTTKLLGKEHYSQVVGCNYYDYLDGIEAAVTRSVITNITKEYPRTKHAMSIHSAEKNSPVHIEWQYCGIFKDNGELYKVLGVGRDITDRVELLQRINVTEGRYRDLFNNMAAGVCLNQIICTDQGHPCDYVFMDINKAFADMFGVTRNIIGKRVTEVLPNTDPCIIERFGVVTQTGKPDSFECRFVDVDKWFQVTAFKSGLGRFAATFFDVTDRYNRNGKLERRTDKQKEGE